VVHIICGTGDPGVALPALPDKLEEVVDAGENVVHEDDGFKVLGITEVVGRAESGITDFNEGWLNAPRVRMEVLMETRRPTNLVRASKMRRALVWSAEPFS